MEELQFITVFFEEFELVVTITLTFGIDFGSLFVILLRLFAIGADEDGASLGHGLLLCRPARFTVDDEFALDGGGKEKLSMSSAMDNNDFIFNEH